jgi:hypothetical protein
VSLPFLWGGWQDQLVGYPTMNYSVHLKNIPTLGYLVTEGGQMFSTKRSSNQTVVDPLYQAYDPALENVPVSTSYGYIIPNWECLSNQLRLYDHPEPPELNLDQAEHEIVKMFEHLGVYSKKLTLDQLVINKESSAGFGYQPIYGSKGNMLKRNRKEIEEFCSVCVPYDLRVLWTMFGKQEYLPMEKILTDMGRSIQHPPLTFLAFHMMCNQHFDKKLVATNKQSPIQLGVVFQNGGFHRLFEKYNFPDSIKGMGDVRRWDKFFNTWLRMRCMRVRVRLFKGTPAEAAAYVKEMEYLYKHLTWCCLVLPWGQVIILCGMKSGDGSTSPDNSLGHLFVYFYMILSLNTKERPIKSWQDVLYFAMWLIYADDHVFCIRPEISFLSSFDLRREFYAKFGFELKQSDDRVSKTFESLTFLGAKIVKYFGIRAPCYNLDRIWSSIIYNRLTEPVEVYNKLCSLLILSAFNGEQEFDLIDHYLRWVIREFDAAHGTTWPRRSRSAPLFKTSLPFIPPFQWCVRFWLGYEDGPAFATLDPAVLSAEYNSLVLDNPNQADLTYIYEHQRPRKWKELFPPEEYR